MYAHIIYTYIYIYNKGYITWWHPSSSPFCRQETEEKTVVVPRYVPKVVEPKPIHVAVHQPPKMLGIGHRGTKYY